MPLQYPPAHRPRTPSSSAAVTHSAPRTLWAPPGGASNRFVFQLVLSIAGVTTMLVAIGYIALATGLVNTSVAFVLALIPLAIVLFGVRWLDRWDPEPKTMLVMALLWGAGVAVLSALVINSAAMIRIYASTQDPTFAQTYGAVFVAPISEEIVKGIGVLLIFIVRRQHLDGPVDGVVYAATIGAGFAFTENILYFSQNAAFVLEVFVLRGLFSPFAHALFTACTGLAIGLAARSSRRFVIVLALPLGLFGAIGLHALWNGSASLSGNFFLIYLLVQVPLFLAMVGLLLWLRRLEARIIRDRLSEYVPGGWFAPQEVDMLSSLRLRREAMVWSARLGDQARSATKAFQRQATTLAYLRQKVRLGRSMTGERTEAEVLQQIAAARQVVAAAAATRAV